MSALFDPSSLPAMPAPGGAAHPSPSCAQDNARPKRRLSTAHSFDPSEHDHDDHSKQRSKRSRQAATATQAPSLADAAAARGSDPTATPAGSPPQPPSKALSDKDKDSRRQARMIRNRNAAQASRDRKKEHTAFLERRVAQLEAQLRGGGVHPLAASVSATPSSSISKPPRSQRSTSVASSAGESHESSQRIVELEDENDALRTQLHLEQVETARLRSRLDLLEDKFARFSDSYPPPSGTATPLPAFEPTFAFDTTDIKPLPQPEELAFVEARNRENQLRAATASTPKYVAQAPLGPMQEGQAVPLSSSGSSPSTTSSISPALSASVSSTPGSVASLDLASTPPATESYLDELDDLAPPPMWNEWVKPDALDHDVKPEDESAVNSALAFVDFEFLNDGPVIASC
ncbi:hypothetical protein JCM10212_000729 [Sporobolomyces blumeae]